MRKMSSLATVPLFGLLLLVLALSGCTFVTLAPEAEAVRIVDEQEAASCKELGTTRVEVMGKVGFVYRSAKKISVELDTLARNAGADLDGNAVVPSGPVAEGKRTYRVLRCP
jgi:hypothetical protein